MCPIEDFSALFASIQVSSATGWAGHQSDFWDSVLSSSCHLHAEAGEEKVT
jgi:hypothetical protein